MVYQLKTLPASRRALKKLPRKVREHVVNEAKQLANNPRTGDQLEGRWRFLYSLHTRYKGADYRLVYEIDDKGKEIIVRYMSSRENFYRKLQHMKLKPLVR